jgi:hypothetical protein
MLDIFNIPSNNTTQYFYANSGSWQTWQKPRNAKFIQIFCLGSGAGGQSGNVGGTTSTAGRGGGGAGLVRGIIPAFLIPDTLYIQILTGGAGGVGANIAGASGSISYISIAPTASIQTLIAASSNTPASPANITTATVSSITSSVFANLGIFTAILGPAGAASNTNSSAFTSNTLVTGGAGGGTYNAGNVTLGFAVTGSLNNIVLGGQSTGSNGDNGNFSLNPFYATGGAGGSAGTSSVINGGRGGNGSYGCGGGGGGGSFTGGSSPGGNGGDGLVIITTIT